MEAVTFWEMFKQRGLTFFAGVPDSTFQAAYDAMLRDPEICYVPAVREDVALGVASAAYFVGRRGGVILQNSGLGNLVNPLTSFSLMYQIPLLLLIGWRGYGGPPNDAPEHWIMGDKTPAMLDLLGIPYAILESEQPASRLDALLEEIEAKSLPGALLVRAGVIT
ncbi:sulfopyruvate decarboxylase subunit alpha [Candidatus Entotheonella serta]|nr:sulfopyruvate decarboxylase subunit alpha [Candidatus Entotheonella serta]